MKRFLIPFLIIFSLFIIACGDSGEENESTGKSSTGADETDTGSAGSNDQAAPGGDTSSDSSGSGGQGDTGSNGSTGDEGSSGNKDDGSGNNDAGDSAAEEPGEPEGDQAGDTGDNGKLVENPFVDTSEEPVSTFSIDVDTASYTLIRNYLLQYNQMPPVERVRIEEMINYFDYSYPQPQDDRPFSVTMEMSASPWKDNASLVMIGLQGKEVDKEQLPASNLVFLIDVSGSMSANNKLPLLKKSFLMLVDRLSEKDTVSIVTYAGSAGVVLDSVTCDQKDKIKEALTNLQSGGSTAGAEGIITAYEIAEKNLKNDGNNRIILATDGDFNVGPSSDEELENLIIEKRDKGIFLTILGFGMGNYQDGKMETIADKGNGNYFYIDTEKEAEKVFLHDLTGNLFTIAKDVKLQVEFNPAKIKEYRLIGYENRVMPNQDFDDDTKDAGEIGSGHRVTAFYEVILQKESPEPRDVEVTDSDTEISDDDNIGEDFKPVEFNENEYIQLRMRYKEPDQDISKYFDRMMTGDEITAEMSDNMGFASSVIEFGMLLRRSEFKENSSYDNAYERAEKYIGDDIFGFRSEFLEMITRAKKLDN